MANFIRQFFDSPHPIPKVIMALGISTIFVLGYKKLISPEVARSRRNQMEQYADTLYSFEDKKMKTQ